MRNERIAREGTSGVVMLRWPEDAELRDELAASHRARLLLVPRGDAPPLAADPLEDWMWEPGDGFELALRVEALSQRVIADRPRFDVDGVLHAGGRWTTLAPHELPVARVLVEHFGEIVARDLVITAAWPGAEPKPAAVNLVVHRVRNRVQAQGLAVRAFRGRGFLMDWAAADAGPTPATRPTERPGSREDADAPASPAR
jgi:DNA-binding winged helix-turn-helix (wHTH) protein